MSAPGVSDSEARAVLREHGRQVGARGRLSEAQWEDYRALTEGEVADLDDGPPENSAPAAPAAPAPEQPPRRVGPPGGVRGIWDKRPGAGAQGKRPGGGKKKARREHPWRSTAGLIERGWSRVAQAAGFLPPLQRILAAQAPLAGVVFEGQFRDSLIDRAVLQPAARYEAQGEALAAMIGVPLFTVLTAVRGRTYMEPGADGQMQPVRKPDGSPAWDPVTDLTLIAPLRTCLTAWFAVSERHEDEVIAKAEATIAQTRKADALIAWIFSPPDPDAGWDDVEADARARARQFTRPRPAAERQEPGPGSSAYAPARTISVLPAVIVE